MRKCLFVVDAKNNPLDVKLARTQVHRKGLWHRTVHIWVINPTCKFLLVKRGDWKSQDPGMWASYIGGHVLYQETYEDCALREVEEEIGIKLINPERLIPIHLKKSKASKEFSRYFLLKLPNLEIIKGSKKEFTKILFARPNFKNIRALGINNISGGFKYVEFQIKKLKGLVAS